VRRRPGRVRSTGRASVIGASPTRGRVLAGRAQWRPDPVALPSGQAARRISILENNHETVASQGCSVQALRTVSVGSAPSVRGHTPPLTQLRGRNRATDGFSSGAEGGSPAEARRGDLPLHDSPKKGCEGQRARPRLSASGEHPSAACATRRSTEVGSLAALVVRTVSPTWSRLTDYAPLGSGQFVQIDSLPGNRYDYSHLFFLKNQSIPRPSAAMMPSEKG
jgi:hypothetical protein